MTLPAGHSYFSTCTPFLEELGFVVNLTPSGMVASHPKGVTVTASRKRTKVEAMLPLTTHPKGRFLTLRTPVPPTNGWILQNLMALPMEVRPTPPGKRPTVS